MEVKEIISQLETFDGSFPKEALEAAIERKEEIIPELLKMLKYTVENAEKAATDEYWGHTYALYLLAQFGNKEAYPLFIELLSLPNDTLWALLGELDGWDSVLASVSCGDDSMILQLIENDNIDEYARCVALNSLVTLHVAGKKKREEIIEYFSELFNGKLDRSFSAVWMGLVNCCLDLYADELHDDIIKAIQDDLVWEGEISISDVEEVFAEDKQTVIDKLFKSERYQLIDDTIKEIEWWSCFKDNKQLDDDIADSLFVAISFAMTCLTAGAFFSISTPLKMIAFLSCLIGGDPLHRLTFIWRIMKLITEEFETLFKDYPLYSQEHEKDPLVIAKLFDPTGSASWFLLEYDPVEKLAFGYVTGMTADELGYISLTEMESIKGPLGIGIEQDMYFIQKQLSELK
ncbi:MAG: DUF1186 domain-containing protein [Bacteroidetes bacterium]|nr:DUF1186 domain-containing protein [Bacteroidota bacterium]